MPRFSHLYNRMALVPALQLWKAHGGVRFMGQSPPGTHCPLPHVVSIIILVTALAASHPPLPVLSTILRPGRVLGYDFKRCPASCPLQREKMVNFLSEGAWTSSTGPCPEGHSGHPHTTWFLAPDVCPQ